MAMSVVYATVNGALVEEDRGGVVTCYVSDTLGSVVKTTDASGSVTSTAAYWPFGEVRTSSGTNPSPWGFVGTLGYYKDALSRLYIRARTLRTDLSRWLSVDPIWPDEWPYLYADNRPEEFVDPNGLQAIKVGQFPEGCRGCGQAIYDNWFPEKPHKCNACYAHCTSCCVLTVLAGKDCAIDTQNLQNVLSNPGEEYIRARWRYCGKGLGVASTITDARNAFSQCSSGCLKKCPYKVPNPRPDCNKWITPDPKKPGTGKPTFPPEFKPLTQCDPEIWLKCKQGGKP